MKSPQGLREAPPNTETDPASRFPTNRKGQGQEKSKEESELAGKQSWGRGCRSPGRAGPAEGLGSRGLAVHAPYLGPVPLLGHHLGLLLQQGPGELFHPPRRLLFLRLLLVRFPGLQLVLCNLGTQSRSPETRPRAEPASDQEGSLWICLVGESEESTAGSAGKREAL